MTDHIEPQWVTIPDGIADAGVMIHYEVGKSLPGPGGIVHRKKITRITIQEDEPGMHCHMRRVCIWGGDKLLAEAPFISVGAVGYE